MQISTFTVAAAAASPDSQAAHVRVLPLCSLLFRGKLGGGGGGGATDLSGKNCGGALEFWKRRSSFTRRAAQNFFKAQFPHHTYLLLSSPFDASPPPRCKTEAAFEVRSVFKALHYL